MLNELSCADELRELLSELPLRGADTVNRGEGREVSQRVSDPSLCRYVQDWVTSGLCFEHEGSGVGQNEGELLLVIWPRAPFL